MFSGLKSNTPPPLSALFTPSGGRRSSVASTGGQEAPTEHAQRSELLVAVNRLHGSLWVQNACVAIIASIMVGAAIHWLQPVLVPLVLAILLSYVLMPLISFCRTRLYMPHLAAVAVSVAVALLVCVMVANLLYQSVRDLASNTDVYVKRINAIAETVDAIKVKQPGETYASRFEMPSLLDIAKTQIAKLPIGTLVAQTVKKYLEDLAMGLSNTFLVFLFVIYLLERKKKDRGLIAKGTYAEQIERRIKQYLLMKSILNLAVALSCTFVYWLLNVDMAMMFGLFTFILKFIPEAGTIVALILPLPLVLINEDSSLTRVVLVLVLPLAFHLFISNIVETKVLGDQLELHPVTILTALIFWGMLWGIPGLLLAAPMTATLKILLDGHETTKPIAKVLAGQLDDIMEMRGRHGHGVAEGGEGDVEDGTAGAPASGGSDGEGVRERPSREGASTPARPTGVKAA